MNTSPWTRSRRAKNKWSLDFDRQNPHPRAATFVVRCAPSPAPPHTPHVRWLAAPRFAALCARTCWCVAPDHPHRVGAATRTDTVGTHLPRRSPWGPTAPNLEGTSPPHCSTRHPKPEPRSRPSGRAHQFYSTCSRPRARARVCVCGNTTACCPPPCLAQPCGECHCSHHGCAGVTCWCV